MAKIILFGSLIFGVMTIAVCLVFYEAVLVALWWIGIGGGVFLALAGIITLSVGTFRALGSFEEWQEKRAIRHQKEMMVVQDGIGQSFLIRAKDDIIALTTNPAFHINGKPSEPTQAELMMQALFFQAVGRGHVERQGASVPLLPATIEPSTPELLPILDKAQRVLIRAVSDGGKTTLLQHIAARRNGAVLVIDSQSYPGKWPERCKVVGAGSDHAAISVTLDNLIELMVKRYQEIGGGLVKEGEHPKLTIIIDEWMAIVHECSNASDVIRRLLTESRKAAFSVFIGSHSERVKALGLDGQGDLRDGFLIVRIEIENGQRVATYDYGRGERPCVLPGEYVPDTPGDVFEIEAIATPIETEQKQDLTDKELQWINMVKEGATKSDACWKVFGRAFSGPFSQKLNRLLSSSSEG